MDYRHFVWRYKARPINIFIGSKYKRAFLCNISWHDLTLVYFMQCDFIYVIHLIMTTFEQYLNILVAVVESIFAFSIYREKSPGGLCKLMSAGRGEQIWTLLFVKPLSQLLSPFRNTDLTTATLSFLLSRNLWKLLSFEAKKRLVNCILQKIKWRILIKQTLLLFHHVT